MIYNSAAIIYDGSNTNHTTLINQYLTNHDIKFIKFFEDLNAVKEYNKQYENFCLFEIVICVGNSKKVKRLIHNQFQATTPAVIDLKEVDRYEGRV